MIVNETCQNLFARACRAVDENSHICLRHAFGKGQKVKAYLVTGSDVDVARQKSGGKLQPVIITNCVCRPSFWQRQPHQFAAKFL